LRSLIFFDISAMASWVDFEVSFFMASSGLRLV
jgi:hypothetical protein